MQIEIKRYNSSLKHDWDNFVKTAKNGTFLFHRNFMEYHSDRFIDLSLLFYHQNKLVALLPANVSENVAYTHQGLTYGGFILNEQATTKLVLHLFEALKNYLTKEGVFELIYKAIPHIYHKQPAEEDAYALFRYKAKLIGCSVSSCIKIKDQNNYSTLRKRGIKKAQTNNLLVNESTDFATFWQILDLNLQNSHNTKPVHSLAEITLLKKEFPNNIRLFEVKSQASTLGGCVVFDMPHIAHVQYISASEAGKQIGALDFLFDHLISNIYSNKEFFDFGISTEKNGTILNEGLISQKEGFGARGIVYNTYQLHF